MSMPRGCLVVEKKPGEWFCCIADRADDYNPLPGKYAVYGPKPTADAALDAALEREANPGSFDIVPHDEVDEDTAKMVENGRYAQQW